MKITLSQQEIFGISHLFNEVCHGFNTNDIFLFSQEEVNNLGLLDEELFWKNYKKEYEFSFEQLMNIYKVILENYIYFIVLERDDLNSRASMDEKDLFALKKKFEALLKEEENR
jgi:hypothetical protein